MPLSTVLLVQHKGWGGIRLQFDYFTNSFFYMLANQGFCTEKNPSSISHAECPCPQRVLLSMLH